MSAQTTWWTRPRSHFKRSPPLPQPKSRTLIRQWNPFSFLIRSNMLPAIDKNWYGNYCFLFMKFSTRRWFIKFTNHSAFDPVIKVSHVEDPALFPLSKTFFWKLIIMLCYQCWYSFLLCNLRIFIRLYTIWYATKFLVWIFKGTQQLIWQGWNASFRNMQL